MTSHEHQVSALAPTLTVASATHLDEISLSSPNAQAQANLRRSEQNPSVSYRYKCVMTVIYDQQAQQSMSGVFANARNVLITGGTIVSLCCSYVWFPYLFYEQNVFPGNAGEEQINIPVVQMPNSSPFFTGRQDVLDKLEMIFTHQVTNRRMSRRSCLLWGMGGIGKTQICLKFLEEMSHK